MSPSPLLCKQQADRDTESTLGRLCYQAAAPVLTTRLPASAEAILLLLPFPSPRLPAPAPYQQLCQHAGCVAHAEGEQRSDPEKKKKKQGKKMFIFQLDWLLLWVTAQQGKAGMRASAEDGVSELSVSEGPHNHCPLLPLCVVVYVSFAMGFPYFPPKFRFLPHVGWL